jgi:hypothetical protein
MSRVDRETRIPGSGSAHGHDEGPQEHEDLPHLEKALLLGQGCGPDFARNLTYRYIVDVRLLAGVLDFVADVPPLPPILFQ